MNEAVITIIVTGVIQVTGLVVGFLTLWVKLQYAGTKAAEAVIRADAVEGKLDANTATTNSLDLKADTIVHQTNGASDQMRNLVKNIADRVSKLEDYNRESSHRLFDALNAVGLKIERLLAVQEVKAAVTSTQEKK